MTLLNDQQQPVFFRKAAKVFARFLLDGKKRKNEIYKNIGLQGRAYARHHFDPQASLVCTLLELKNTDEQTPLSETEGK